MSRRLILAALALLAFLSLESCGVNRVAGPVNDSRSFGARHFERDGDGSDQTLGGASAALPDMGDSLKVFRSPSPIGGAGGDGGSGDPVGTDQPKAK